MRIRLVPALVAAAAALGACSDALNVKPVNDVPSDQAIVDAVSAKAALAGAYDALQDGSYYGGDFMFFSDLPSDNAEHVGTFTDFADVDANSVRADNGAILGIWTTLYEAIGRANSIIEKMPTVRGLDEDTKNQYIGEALFIRALTYHNLVKLWGPVPLRTKPIHAAGDAANTTNATVAEIYTQILADLDQAEDLMSDEAQTTKASVGAVRALRSRVLLYKGDFPGAEAAAQSVIDMGYELAPDFTKLFDKDGTDTPEDIFKVAFTAQEYNNLGYYYISRSYGGRRELGPTRDLELAFTDPNDVRKAWTVQRDSRNRRYGAKFPTTIGAEDIHVIRFAEVLLIKAEAQARQNKLADAVTTMNLVRARAHEAAYVFGTQSQAEVIAEILRERRLELAFEGDRWPDLIRTGMAESVLGLDPDQLFQLRFPIPQNEVDVSPHIQQNPGY